MNNKKGVKELWLFTKKHWTHILFITCLLYHPIRLVESADFGIFSVVASVIFFLLVIASRYQKVSSVMKYFYALAGFALYMVTFNYYNLDFYDLNKIAFFFIILYSYLLRDMISPNLIALIISVQYSTYIGQKPKDYVIGVIVGLMISSLAYSAVFNLVHHLTLERNRFRSLSLADPLTGVATLSHTIELGQKFIDEGYGVAVLAVDLDHFKQVNDTYGHMVGNEVLKQVAQLLVQQMKDKDCVVGRLGGDEFVILVKNYTWDGMGRVSQKLFQAIKDKQFYGDPDIDPIKLSFSIGEAYCKPGSSASIETLLHKADVDMYRNKYENHKTNVYAELDKPRIVEEARQLLVVLAEKDMYTYVHSGYTAQYAVIIAREMMLDDEVVDAVYTAGWLHDIGKILIPSDIIRKTKKLTESEYYLVKQHVKLGLSILSNLELTERVISAIKYHHERWDGNGYPFNVSGEETPLEARILQVADSFSAMRIKRLYRSPVSKEEAMNEIGKNSGTQFDPSIVSALIKSKF